MVEIVKDKILLRLDSKNVNGYVYPKELAFGMIDKINKDKVTGLVYGKNNPLSDKDLSSLKISNPKYYITNPHVIIDEEDGDILMLVDVVFEEELFDYTADNWRLSVAGTGKVEKDIVIEFELCYTNIEIID